MRFTLVLALLLAAPLWAEEGPNPSDIFIEKIQYIGDGCAPGTVAANLSGDARAFTLLYDSFVVDTTESLEGTGVGKGKGKPKRPKKPRPVGDKRKVCNLSLDLHVPEGWSFAVLSVDYRGFVSLEEKAKAFQRTFIRLNNRLVEAGKLDLKGATEQDYFHRTVSNDLDFSPCVGKRRTVQVQAAIQVNGFGFMTVDSTDAELTEHYGLVWRQCPGPKPKPEPKPLPVPKPKPHPRPMPMGR